MRPNATPPEHKSSVLLTPEENEQVFRLLGNRCQTLSTTVIQLFSTDGPDKNEWHKRCFGVLCLVKDNPRKSYFFRLFCLTRKQLLWEHELYKGMEYMAPQNFLHIFEAEDCVVAFNFASEEEARDMRAVILEKQKRLERRHRDRTNNSQQRHSSTPGLDRERSRTLQPATITNGTKQSPIDRGVNHVRSLSSGRGENRRRDHNNKRKPNKLTKADISSPTQFRHVSHVGFDPNKGFDAVDIDNSPELKAFFEKAGVSSSQLRDPRTREFIYDFISRNGGLDAAKEEAHLPPPPVPARYPSAGGGARQAPPPPPQRTAHVAPPPLPPLRTLPSRATNNNNNSNSNNNTSSTLHDTPQSQSTMHIPPPPPTPPPPPSLPPPTMDNIPPAPPSMQPPPQPDTRSALMDAIRSGAKLKPVDPDSKKSTLNNDSRGELLDQIRQGVKLNSVQPVAKPTGSASLPGLAGALAAALEERSRALHSDSDSTSDTDEDNDEDEWED
uniref:Neural Wiskott-Aldrich syndrome protein n=3 Tax=Cacopsylla melanoneura TaxID=428564 RepID=A0A8D8LHC9_9HEMI